MVCPWFLLCSLGVFYTSQACRLILGIQLKGSKEHPCDKTDSPQPKLSCMCLSSSWFKYKGYPVWLRKDSGSCVRRSRTSLMFFLLLNWSLMSHFNDLALCNWRFTLFCIHSGIWYSSCLKQILGLGRWGQMGNRWGQPLNNPSAWFCVLLFPPHSFFPIPLDVECLPISF